MSNLDKDWERIAKLLYRKGIISLCSGALVAKRAITAPVGRIDSSLSYEHVYIDENIRFDYFKPKEPTSKHALLLCPGSAYAYPPQRSHHAWAQYLCKKLGWPVFIVHHRLSPKYAFPVPYDDALDTINWIINQAQVYHFSPDKVVLVGESSGAATVAAVCHAFRDAQKKAVCHQVLIYPTLDADTIVDDPNYQDDFLVEKNNRSKMLEVYRRYYAPGNPSDPRAWPLNFSNYRDLPPATILLASLDRFYHDGSQYFDRLQAHDTPATLQSYDGVTHGFISFIPNVKKAVLANRWLVSHLKKTVLGTSEERAYSPET